MTWPLSTTPYLIGARFAPVLHVTLQDADPTEGPGDVVVTLIECEVVRKFPILLGGGIQMTMSNHNDSGKYSENWTSFRDPRKPLYKHLTTTQALQGTNLVLCTDELGDQCRRTTSLQQHLHQVSVPAQRRKVQSSATILRESASPTISLGLATRCMTTTVTSPTLPAAG